jgi:hypothetical protein
MLRPVILSLCASMLCMAGGTAPSREHPAPLPEQAAPFSVWLDFPALAKPGAADPALPIWFESLQTLRAPAQGEQPPKTFYRLRLRRLPSLQNEILLRVFFDDLPDMQPVISGWTETGRERFRSEPLGTGVGLPTSEAVIVPLDGVDYVDVEVAGNGSNVRGTLAASLKEVSVRQTLDFRPAPEVITPFGGTVLGPVLEEDRKLYGRVQSTLETTPIRLSPEGNPAEVFEVDLAAQPLTAVLNFEVLNADLNAPPNVSVNDAPPTASQVHWPDLADPGYRGEARGDEARMRFQYTGWLPAQIAIPAAALRPGLNKLTIALSDSSGPVAIRNVELQLKQNWKHFDYILTPATR